MIETIAKWTEDGVDSRGKKKRVVAGDTGKACAGTLRW
jgi:hypothetical protein